MLPYNTKNNIQDVTLLLLHCDSIITRSSCAPKYSSSILCVKMSADDRSIHNASCENRTPCLFPSQV